MTLGPPLCRASDQYGSPGAPGGSDASCIQTARAATFTKNVVQLYVQPMLFYYMQTQLVSVMFPKRTSCSENHQLWGETCLWTHWTQKKNRMTSRRNLGMGQPWDLTLITNWSLFNMKHPNLVVIIFVSFDQSPSEASLRWHQNAPLPPARHNTVRLRIHDDPVTSLHQRWNDAGHSGDTRRIPLTLTCSYGDHTLLGMQWAQYIYI